MHIRLFSDNDIPPEVRQKIEEFDYEGIIDFIPDLYNFKIGIVYDDNQEIMALGIVRAITEFKMARELRYELLSY
jgi:hypothetical protein